MTGMTWEAGDLEYEVCVVRVHAGDHGSYWQPPEPGEVELNNIVDVYISPTVRDVTTWDAFILAIAAENGWSLDKASDKVHEAALEAAIEDLRGRADDYEDRDDVPVEY